jgi:hypothetical protein
MSKKKKNDIERLKYVCSKIVESIFLGIHFLKLQFENVKKKKKKKVSNCRKKFAILKTRF